MYSNKPVLRRIFFVLIIAIGIGATFGVYFYLSGSTQDLRFILTSILYSVNIGTFMMLIIYNRIFFLRFVEQQYIQLMGVIILLALAALAGTELTRFISASFIFQKEYFPFEEVNLYFLNIIIVLVTGLPIYEREVWKTKTLTRLEKQEYELLKLEQLKTLSDLETLRAKINPHFLYNIHNTIASLIRINPVQAEKMILALSRFFRFTLAKTSSTYHSIRDEMEIVKTYLELQQIRFGSRLQVVYEVDENLLQNKIPSFLLQPLIENAFKHSFDKTASTLELKLAIYRKNNIILLEVQDNGPPFPEEINYGYGFQSILNKLNILSRDNFKFSFQNKPIKQVQIELMY